ncbi:MAG TPA: aldo/keto reductase [Methanoregulaceae archaeon]|nr:aldo/keto reductase [Methanoregulaceae archaeon]HPD74720.1 aldo/keto reductase [Methanoregulaceae archaeon]
MLYRSVPKTGDRLSILGYGCMRLPTTRTGGVDEERTVRQIRHAIDAGINYLDTAPIYHLGRSELVLAKALEGDYRKKVRIATKLPHWEVYGRGDMERILNRQLSILKTRHIDYYLLHSLGRGSFLKLRNLGVLDFLDDAKKDGRIRNAGFSFHGNLSAFKEIVDAYDWQFCQIQYNYLDEKNQAGTEGLEYAAGKGLAVMIMEPLRGGNLAGRIPEQVRAIWDAAPVKRTPAEWGLRWVWNHPEVTVVLSGMNDEAHIDENIHTAGEGFEESLTSEEIARIDKVRDIYRDLMKVACTGCGYCMPCPAGVDIPGCFADYNAASLFPRDRAGKFQYVGRHGGLMGEPSYAGLCRTCGKCAKACPQHLPIPALMKAVSAEMESMMWAAIPVMKGALWCMNKAARIRHVFMGE